MAAVFVDVAIGVVCDDRDRQRAQVGGAGTQFVNSEFSSHFLRVNSLPLPADASASEENVVETEFSSHFLPTLTTVERKSRPLSLGPGRAGQPGWGVRCETLCSKNPPGGSTTAMIFESSADDDIIRAACVG